MSLNDMANSSNEGRLQRIMLLRQLFMNRKVVTVKSAVQRFGVSEPTVLKYCHDGDIPLFDSVKQRVVVPLTDKNRPQWY